MRLPWINCVLLIGASSVSLASLTSAGRNAAENNLFSAPHYGDPASVITTLLEQASASVAHFYILQKRLQVVLGYPWSLSAVLPWNAAVETASGWDAYARSIFQKQANNQEVHRQVTNHQTVQSARIQIEAAGYGCDRLAFSANDYLLTTVTALAKTAGWYCSSYRDLTALAIATHQAELPDACRLIVIDAAAHTCLFRQGGMWVDVMTLLQPEPAIFSEQIFSAATLMCGQPDDLPTLVTATHNIAEIMRLDRHDPSHRLSGNWQWLGAPSKKLAALTEIMA